MLQEIAPHIYHNEFRRPAPAPTDLAAVFDGKSVLLTEEGGGFPTVETLRGLGVGEEDLAYLFTIDDTAFFLLWQVTEPVRAALKAAPTTVFRTMEPFHLRLAGATALHLSMWYRTNRFCGCCGAPTRRDEQERAMRCTACGHIVYPRINPAVVVAVRHGDRLLLTHYADRVMLVRYALIAGFTEIGETMEETVRREVLEEVGLPIKNIRYHGNQPWGFTGNLMVGFWADLDGDDDTVVLDTRELNEGVWLRRDEIPPDHEPIDLTHTMIELFRQGKDPK